jgi:uncharacterized iron-regulated membrane protein
MTLRPFIFWPHLLAGVIAGTVVLIMSVTGVLLTYERQLIAWSDSHYVSSVPSPQARRLSVDRILERAKEHSAGETVTAVAIGAAPEAPVVLTASNRPLYVDAYTGARLGEGSTRIRTMMSRLRAWHRWLAVEGEGRPVARAITGWSNLVFAFIVLSGAYLWLPRVWRWPQVKAVLLFRSRLSGKARDYNWHNVIGVWSAVPLFIVVVSAVPISFQWANAAIYRAVGETPPAGRGGGGGRAEGGRQEGRQGARQAEPGGDARRSDGGRTADRDGTAANSATAETTDFERLFVRAERQVSGWRTITLRLPDGASAPAVFNIDRGDGGQPHLRSTLTLARATGEVVSFEDFSSLTTGRRIRNVMRFAHTGEVLGIAGQTVAGLVSAGAVVLVWTGLALACRRCRAWIARRSSKSTTVPVEDRTSAVA